MVDHRLKAVRPDLRRHRPVRCERRPRQLYRPAHRSGRRQGAGFPARDPLRPGFHAGSAGRLPTPARAPCSAHWMPAAPRCTALLLTLATHTRLLDDDARAVADLAQFVENCKKPLFFVGDGASLCYNKYSNAAGHVLHCPRQLRFGGRSRCRGPGGKADGPAGRSCVLPEALLPDYHRLSQAERERAERRSRPEQSIRKTERILIMAVQFEKPIALGADHGGYELKEAIKEHLESWGWV